MPANFRRPRVGGRSSKGAGENDPAASECSKSGNAAIRQDLALISPPPAALRRRCRQASGNEKGEEQH
jgi:hypothetical protein